MLSCQVSPPRPAEPLAEHKRNLSWVAKQGEVFVVISRQAVVKFVSLSCISCLGKETNQTPGRTVPRWVKFPYKASGQY